jgi:CHAT domain-containing protein
MNGDSSEAGMFLAQLGLTRWVHRGWHPNAVSIRTGRAKYVAPEYELPANRLLEAPAEVRFLENRLGATPVTADFPSVLAVLQQGFDLLHFVCHGLAEQNNIANAALQLSCQHQGGWQTSPLKALVVEQSARLKSADGRQPMVVLNACQTGREGWQLTGTGGFAQAFLKAGAGIFVGTLWSVIDRPARVFVEALYDALLSGKMLGEAAREAREKTKQEEPSSWLAYAVYGDPYARLIKEP